MLSLKLILLIIIIWIINAAISHAIGTHAMFITLTDNHLDLNQMSTRQLNEFIGTAAFFIASVNDAVMAYSIVFSSAIVLTLIVLNLAVFVGSNAVLILLTKQKTLQWAK